VTLLHPVVPAGDRSTSPGDAELILAVRAGDRQAYGTLYERHLAAARAHARQLTRSPADADDLVAEAFAKVFTVLRAGRGPDHAFRAYLMTTLRHGLYERARQDRRLELTDDMARHDHGIPWSDPVEAELNSALAARAFSTLPERWQVVLWRSEVEGETTAEIGERLGLRPNAVAALAYRAREGLRQAYLQAHLTERPDEACRPTVRRLGGWTRGKLPAGDAVLVRQHLDDCGRCRHLAAELADVNDGIRGLLAPLVLAGTTAGYASAAAGISVGGVAAVGPATATGAAGGGSAGGWALGWLLGTHAGQAAAVLAAVVVGGTVVAAGTGAIGVGHQGPASAAVTEAHPGQGAGPAGGLTERTGLRHTVPAMKGGPSSGKRPSGKSTKGSGSTPSPRQPGGKSPDGKSLSSKPSAKQSSGKSASGATTKPSKASSSQGSASAGSAPDQSATDADPAPPAKSGGSSRIGSSKTSQQPATSGSAQQPATSGSASQPATSGSATQPVTSRSAAKGFPARPGGPGGK
jgi:RNA polymerase sigma factor (sigma-70 family)